MYVCELYVNDDIRMYLYPQNLLLFFIVLASVRLVRLPSLLLITSFSVVLMALQLAAMLSYHTKFSSDHDDDLPRVQGFPQVVASDRQTSDERMPWVFLLPYFTEDAYTRACVDFPYTTASVLDLILQGLFLSYVVGFDLMVKPIFSYMLVAIIGYFLGALPGCWLMMTTDDPSFPPLGNLPGMLILVLGFAKLRGELHNMWWGVHLTILNKELDKKIQQSRNSEDPKTYSELNEMKNEEPDMILTESGKKESAGISIKGSKGKRVSFPGIHQHQHFHICKVLTSVSVHADSSKDSPKSILSKSAPVTAHVSRTFSTKDDSRESSPCSDPIQAPLVASLSPEMSSLARELARSVLSSRVMSSAAGRSVNNVTSSGSTYGAIDVTSSGVRHCKNDMMSSGVRNGANGVTSSGARHCERPMMTLGVQKGASAVTSGVRIGAKSVTSSGVRRGVNDVTSSGVQNGANDVTSSGVRLSESPMMSSGYRLSTHYLATSWSTQTDMQQSGGRQHDRGERMPLISRSDHNADNSLAKRLAERYCPRYAHYFDEDSNV